MTKIIEIVFRHKWGVLALLIVPIVVSGVIAYKQPRMYQASVGLWALRRYEIIGASGPEADLTSTPAQTQATTVGEFLQSRSFALAVAYESDLPKLLAASNLGTQNLQDALYTEISGKVVATPVGYNLFDITYANTDATVALQVVKAVATLYGADSGSQATVEGERLLVNYETQLTAAQQAADAADQAAAQYLREHQLTAQQAAVDPQYQLLAAQANQASTVVTTVQDDINTVKQQLAVLGTGAAGLYTVIDAASVPNRAVSRTKTLLLTGGIGLAVGVLAAIGYLLLLVRLDLSLYSREDVPVGVAYPVLVQVPRIRLSKIVPNTQATIARLLARKLLPR